MAGPGLGIEYSDTGAAKVQNNLRTTEQVVEKLKREMTKLDKAAQLAAARRASPEFQAKLENLAKAQGKFKEETKESIKSVEQFKNAIGVTAINQARELGTALIGMAKGIFEVGKAGANARQLMAFSEMEQSVSEARDELQRFTAAVLADTGALEAMSDVVRDVSSVVGGLTDSWAGLDEASGGILNDAAAASFDALFGPKALSDLVHNATGVDSVAQAWRGGVAEVKILTPEMRAMVTQLGKEEAAHRRAKKAIEAQNEAMSKAVMATVHFRGEVKELTTVTSWFAQGTGAPLGKFTTGTKKQDDATTSLTRAVRDQTPAVWSLITPWSELTGLLSEAASASLSLAQTDVLGLAAAAGAGVSGRGVGGRIGVIGASIGGQAGAGLGADVGQALPIAEQEAAMMRLGDEVARTRGEMAAFAGIFTGEGGDPLAESLFRATDGLTALTSTVAQSAPIIAKINAGQMKGFEATANAVNIGTQAVGSFALAFIDNERQKAGVLAAMEVAAAFAAYPDFAGIAAHGAAAAQYALIAGGALGAGSSEARAAGAAGGSGGAGLASSAQIGVTNGPDRATSMGGGTTSTTNIFVTTLDPEPGRVGRGIAKQLNGEAQRRSGVRLDPGIVQQTQGRYEV